jgi:hypothetical protein
LVSSNASTSPSRLLALKIRVEVLADADGLQFDPTRLRLTLSGGQKAQVFDRDRAMALLQRTTIALDTSPHISRTDSKLSKLEPRMERHHKQQVMDSLLDVRPLGAKQPAEGYVVVDTKAPYSSLQGSTLVVVAGTSAAPRAARGTYEFANGRRSSDQTALSQ